MKKVLFTISALIVMTTAAWAGHWTAPTGQSTETVVYAKLNLGDQPKEPTWENYEVAAFIDGEVRAAELGSAHTNPAIDSYAEYNYFVLRVKGNFGIGNEDNGKSITFKMYNGDTGLEYDLTVSDAITFDTESHGTASNLIVLSALELTGMDLPSNYTINVGETINLLNDITVTPEGASLPNNLTWTCDEEGLLSELTPGVYKALDKGSIRVTVRATGSIYANTSITILKPATGLTVNQSEITVEKNDADGLNALLATAVVTAPEDATDVIVWSSDDETIVAPREDTDGWNPILGGTTTMKATIYDYSEKEPVVKFQETITVHVHAGVTAIDTRFETFRCSIGDEISEVIKAGLIFTPYDATNTEVTFSLAPGGPTGVLSIGNDGKITATDVGNCGVLITSVDNPQVTNIRYVDVYNSSTSIDVKEETIYVDYQTVEPLDVTDLILDNYSFLPEGSTAERYSLESDNAEVAYIDNNGKVLVTGMGESTITVTLEYTDWLNQTKAYAGMAATEYELMTSATFTLVVTQGVSGFTIEVPDPMMIGNEYNIKLIPQPQGATVDLSQLTLTVTSSDKPEDWPYIMVSPANPTVDADGNILVNIFAIGFGQGNINVSYGEKFTCDPKPIDVAAMFGSPEGWMWLSLWGNIPANKMDEAMTAIGNSIEEIRSQELLMALDPQLGYFGDLYESGLQQGVAYKVKGTQETQVADAYPIYGAQILKQSQTVPLYKGWTWLANPYAYSDIYTLAEILPTATEGDRIVSQEDGFAEYNGQSWEGGLPYLQSGLAYLYYNNSEEAGSLTWPAETSLFSIEKLMNSFIPEEEQEEGEISETIIEQPIDAGPKGSRRHAPRQQGFWKYNPRQFRDNMSIIARVDELSDVEDYTIGAFVGDECRGEGKAVNGKMFITVHAQQGEQITFRLRNEQTGELFDLDQTVPMSLKLGSLKSPLRLSSQAVVTGINDATRLNNNEQITNKCFDLQGRQSYKGKGIRLERQADGTVRKVLK